MQRSDVLLGSWLSCDAGVSHLAVILGTNKLTTSKQTWVESSQACCRILDNIAQAYYAASQNTLNDSISRVGSLNIHLRSVHGWRIRIYISLTSFMSTGSSLINF